MPTDGNRVSPPGAGAENPGVGGSNPSLSTISYTYGPPHDPGVASWGEEVTDFFGSLTLTGFDACFSLEGRNKHARQVAEVVLGAVRA